MDSMLRSGTDSPKRTFVCVRVEEAEMVLQADPPTTAATKDWHRIFDSLTEEHDYVIDEVEGTVPVQLSGTLYRNGPGDNEIGGKPFAHLFDGHGLISQFAIEGGRIHYRN